MIESQQNLTDFKIVSSVVVYASFFLGVVFFLGAAAAFFLGAALAAEVLDTRPDLVLVRTVSFFSSGTAYRVLDGLVHNAPCGM